MRFDQNPIWNQKMNEEEVRKIAEQLSAQGKMRFREAASKEEIKRFEDENGVTLPSCYKRWLRYSDGGLLFLPAGVQFYGVAHKPLIDLCEDDRPDDNFVVIGALSMGDPVLFEKGTERVCIYNHEAGRIEDDESYPDFFAFLRDLPDILGIGE